MQYGDSDHGFSISNEVEGIRLCVWGFWRADVAEAFTTRGLLELEAPLPGQQLVLDASDFKTQGHEGEDCVKSLVNRLVGLGVATVKVQVGSMLARMQLTRLAREQGAPSLFSFDEGACIDGGDGYGER